MDESKYVDIIGAVNSPLALAALSLLVVGSVLLASISKGPSPTLLRYGFGLSALFGILAIAGFVFQLNMARVDVVRGNVENGDGDALDGVVVDLFGVGQSEVLAGRAATTRDGRFAIPLERADRRERYRVEARRAGYETGRKELAGTIPEPGRIVLNQMVFGTSDISVGNTIVVGVFVGAPEIQVEFGANNRTDRDEIIRAISLQLTDPKGEGLTLFPQSYLGDDNRLIPISQSLSLGKLRRSTYRFTWHDLNQMGGLGFKIGQALALSNMATCYPDTMPPQSAEAVARIFDDNFVWSAGVWKARLQVRTDSAEIVKDFSFAVSASDARLMGNMRSVNARCIGLAYGQHAWNDGTARSAAQITRSPD